MSEDLDQQPHRIIVTGGTGELGVAMAEGLLARGVEVGLLDISDDVIEVAHRLRARFGDRRIVAGIADVAASDASDTVDQVVDDLGGLDGLVHAAGIGGNGKTLIDSEMAEIRRIIDVDLIGTFNMARLVGRLLTDQGRGGAIVLIGSIFGQRGRLGSAAYGAAKAGVTHLTESLALELAAARIRVNAIAPGNIATELHWAALRRRSTRENRTFDELVDDVRSHIPLGRHGTGADIADVASWLLSDESSYVTGQTIVADGGALLSHG